MTEQILYADGETDDRDALQAWIDGKPVRFADGSFIDPMHLDAQGKSFYISGVIFIDGQDPDECVSQRTISNAVFNMGIVAMVIPKAEFYKKWVTGTLDSNGDFVENNVK